MGPPLGALPGYSMGLHGTLSLGFWTLQCMYSVHNRQSADRARRLTCICAHKPGRDESVCEEHTTTRCNVLPSCAASRATLSRTRTSRSCSHNSSRCRLRCVERQHLSVAQLSRHVHGFSSAALISAGPVPLQSAWYPAQCTIGIPYSNASRSAWHTRRLLGDRR